MTLLDREFVGDFFRAFVALLFLISIVLLVETLLDYTEQIFGDAQHGVYWTFIYYLLTLPGKLVLTVSFAVGAAVLWVVLRKARNNEILAYLSGGIGPVRLAIPLIFASLVVSGAAVATGELVVSRAERRARFVDQVNLRQKDEGVITQSENIYRRGVNSRLYLVDQYDTAREVMRNVTIVDMHPKLHRPAWLLRAEEARYVERWDENSHWQFTNVTVRRYDEQGHVVDFQSWPELTEAGLDRPMEPRLRQLLDKVNDPEMMSIPQLQGYIEVLRLQGKPTHEMETRLHSRIALPMASLVIALLMCGHALRAKSRGVVYGLGGGVMWIVIFYTATVFLRPIADQGVVPPALAVWAPNVLFAVIGLVKLARGS